MTVIASFKAGHPEPFEGVRKSGNLNKLRLINFEIASSALPLINPISSQ